MRYLSALILLALIACSTRVEQSDATARHGERSDTDAAQIAKDNAGMNPADAARPGRDGMRQARDVFHELLSRHEDIQRTVDDIPGGIRSVTTSSDPQIAALIRLHVRQMAARLEAGMPVRRWDPLFQEIHKHADQIEIKIEDISDGLIVTETSQDPQVVLLIRQHAHQGVSQFVERGFDRAREVSPLPKGYEQED